MAQLSARNKAVLIDAVVHAVNEDYVAMAEDFIKLGFLAPGEGAGTGGLTAEQQSGTGECGVRYCHRALVWDVVLLCKRSGAPWRRVTG